MALNDRAAERARLCFNLAADTRSPAGERAAALNRGMAILARAGLNPDHFTIPGRERPAPCSTAWDGTGRSPWLDGFDRMEAMRAAGQAFSMDEIVREAVRETMRRRRDRAAQEAMFGGARTVGGDSCPHGQHALHCAACMAQAADL